MAREKLMEALRRKGCLHSEEVVKEWAEVLWDRGGAQTEDQAIVILGDALRLADADGVVVKRPRDCGSFIGIVRARREREAEESQGKQVIHDTSNERRAKELAEIATEKAIWSSAEQLEKAREVLSRGVYGSWGKLLETQVKKGFASRLVLSKADKESQVELQEAV
jgi:hypothetical protein